VAALGLQRQEPQEWRDACSKRPTTILGKRRSCLMRTPCFQ
jgi:hypothetical protein